MFGNAPRTVWQKWIAPDDLGRIPLACRALLVEFTDPTHGPQKILFEAGIGAFFEPAMADRFGVQTPQVHCLRENLKQFGVQPEEITAVVLSHLHFDHAGGVLPTYNEIQSGDNGLIFKNAHFYTGREAYLRAKNPHSRDKASFIPGLVEKLESTQRLHLMDGHEKLFNDRLEFVISHGHTPGQLHSLFHGQTTSLFFCGDLIPGIPWVHTPITMGYDRFPEMLIDEKQKFYTQLPFDKTLFYFTHDNDFAAAFLKKEDSKIKVDKTFKTPARQEF